MTLKRYFYGSVILGVMCLLSLALPAVSNEEKKLKKPYSNDNAYVIELLTSPPDMPYLPPYSGKTHYTRLVSLPRAQNPSYVLTFSTKEPSDAVLAWYKEALKQNQWQMNKQNLGGCMLCARRGKTICSVMVMPPTEKGYQSQVRLTYKIHGHS